jgi:pimeloyl-ACP methyl ester carboxylesterase
VRDERIVQANGVDLCVETFGDPADPPILLIMGAAASMDWWPEGFCERLSAASRYVIRYDLRDTGQSTSYEPGAPSYTGSDLVEDAIGLLDTLGIAEAHLVGMSMGGGIAQHLAFEHPDRIASLTLIATSPAGSGATDGGGLPPMSDELRRFFSEPPAEPDWSDRSAVLDYVVAGTRPFQGSVRVDGTALREVAGRVFDRTKNIASSMTNHWILASGDAAEPRLDQIRVPTLVMHGTEDPLFPYEHGEALARAIPGARLAPLDGVGHGELPPATWDAAVAAIVNITSAAGRPSTDPAQF